MTVALKNRQPVVVPLAALRRAGFKSGQELEIKASGGVITIVPRLPTSDSEHTPQQRRIVDAAIAKARKGPYHGPFETADAAISFLHEEVKKRKAAKPRPPGR
jgi:hypothetical protein